MGSTLGKLFCLTTFGESHGPAIGAVVDGCPPGIAVSSDSLQAQLSRRRPGQSALSTARRESDGVRILSGTQDGRTLGTPIGLLIENTDTRPGDYDTLAAVPRPSHGDFTYRAKYGRPPLPGGGRASARETAARVAGGAVAEAFLAQVHGVEIVAFVSAIGILESSAVDLDTVTRTAVDANLVRCPGPEADAMAAAIATAGDEGDSLGGIITGVCRHVPAGWGEPVFDKLEAALAGAMLSIPAVKGFEIGSGFAGTRMRGSEHNDRFVRKPGGLGTRTNHSGGVQAGISNGEPVVFRVALKPVASIARPQETVAYDGSPTVLEIAGRHDPCVAPRAVPVVEAMAALVLADLALQQAARTGSRRDP